jgi:hypothetical protein
MPLMPKAAFDGGAYNFRVSHLTNCIEGIYGIEPSNLSSEGQPILRKAD